MANANHIEILKSGVESWNSWRAANPDLTPDLQRADLKNRYLWTVNLSRADLTGADLSSTFLNHANLAGALLMEADLTKVELTGATLDGANLSGSILRDAIIGDVALPQVATSCKSANFHATDLTDAEFFRVRCHSSDFTDAILRGTSFRNVRLDGVRFLRTDWEGARFVECRVFGVSVWDMSGTPSAQSYLVVTPDEQPTVAIDDLETAQFVYLLLNSKKVRNIIDVMASKGVLILGRFTENRKPVLNALRDALRKLGFLPMMFDFEKSTQRDFTETIKTLAGLSCFVIADITNPKSSPLELQATVPDYMIPFVPIIHEGDEPFSMFADLQQKYRDWVLDVLVYDSTDDLISVLDSAVVQPALEKAEQLFVRKAEGIRIRHARDYRKV
jgi:uncharacterized protein YjbI with pentapeptide repeats